MLSKYIHYQLSMNHIHKANSCIHIISIFVEMYKIFSVLRKRKSMEINVGMMIDDIQEFVLNYYVNIDTLSMMLLNKHYF